jgi:hypothetical protein
METSKYILVKDLVVERFIVADLSDLKDLQKDFKK